MAAVGTKPPYLLIGEGTIFFWRLGVTMAPFQDKMGIFNLEVTKG
jgi:hypothetical protein